MKLNIFEGARRTALLLGALAAIVIIITALNQSVYYRANYSLISPHAQFKLDNAACPERGRIIYFDTKSSGDRKINITVCLWPMNFTNKNKEVVTLIPYRTDADGMTWGAAPYSDEISNYKDQVEKRFVITAADEQIATADGRKRWLVGFVTTLAFLFVGLATFGALVWSVGWIVRGFLGIPRGMDSRPEK